MHEIYVSYRRNDAGGWAGRIHDRLSDHFGAAAVSAAGDAVANTRDIADPVGRRVGGIDVLVAVIGPSWLDAIDPETHTRLGDAADPVRRELTDALAAAAPVVPVLVDGAAPPAASKLPPDLRDLASRQPVVITSGRFEADVARLIAVLEDLRRPRPTRSPTQGGDPAPGRRALLPIAVALALVVLGVVMALLFAAGTADGLPLR